MPRGSTLTISLNAANEFLNLTAAANSYAFTLTNGTNSWTTAAPTNTSISGSTLTVSNKATYTTINISNSATNTGIIFNDSGANTFDSSITATLDLNATSGSVSVAFNGATSFSGTNAISITSASVTVPLVFMDINGDGLQNSTDLSLITARNGKKLP